MLQILAIDLGTETLPALALGREPAEPGLMDRPPRHRAAGRHRPAACCSAPGAARRGLRGPGDGRVLLRPVAGRLAARATRPAPAPRCTTPTCRPPPATFAGIVACQIGTAFAARTDHASLRTVGLFTNPLLLCGIAFEVVFTAAVVWLPAAAAHLRHGTPCPSTSSR